MWKKRLPFADDVGLLVDTDVHKPHLPVDYELAHPEVFTSTCLTPLLHSSTNRMSAGIPQGYPQQCAERSLSGYVTLDKGFLQRLDVAGYGVALV